MNILIVGGTGTIGTHLVHSLSKQDCKIFLLSRNPKKYHKKFDQNISLISWNTNNSNLLKDIDIVVKLSGESVLKLWTKKIKKKILSSRANITKDLRNLVDKGKKEILDGIVIIFAIQDEKIGLAVGITEKLTSKYDAVKFVKIGSDIIGGKGGGGRQDFAQAGGILKDKIDEAFDKIKSLI